MFDNLSFGLDIATALSVIAAAIAFIWNSILARKRERSDRYKEIIKSNVFKVADKLHDESIFLYKMVNNIETRLRAGETTQDLTPFQELVGQLPFIFKSRIEALDKTYCDGRFEKLALEYGREMDDYIHYLARITGPGSDEQWNFHEVMHKPLEITETYITRLFLESEKFINTL